MRPRQLTSIAAAGAAAATLLSTLFPLNVLAIRSVPGRAAMEAAAGVIALFVAFLMYGRFRDRGNQTDLGVALAFGLFASAELLLSTLPTALAAQRPVVFATWAPLLCRLVACLLLALSPFVRDRPLPSARRMARWILPLSLALVGAIAVVVYLLSPLLPAPVEAELTPLVRTGEAVGHPAIRIEQIVAMVLFAVAAAGFTRRAERAGDSFLKWLGAGATLAAFARVNYFLFPSLYSEYSYTGDFLRMAFYAVALFGAALEIESYWRNAEAAAVLDERRRIARDLHDGLAQELAFIARKTRDMSAVDGKQRAVRDLNAAAERALDESRRAIAALTLPLDEPLDAVIAQTAEDVAHRVGVAVRFDLQEGIRVSPEVREQLARIVREAVTNAARHGEAKQIDLSLKEDDRLVLAIADDGCGFDPGDPNPGGFGLVSMRERAEAIGGQLEIDSAPGKGTTVEVTLRDAG